MATSGSFTVNYGGRPAYQLRLVVSRYAVSGSTARWTWSLVALNPSGSSVTWFSDPKPWSVTVAGTTWTGSAALDFRGGQSSITLGSGTTGYKSNTTISFSGYHNTAPELFGNASGSNSFTADPMGGTPGAPATPVYTSRTATSISFNIQYPSNDGGSAILDYTLQASTSSSFASIAKQWVSGSSAQTASGLEKGTKYYFRYRARNKYGSGPWSGTMSQTTLTTVPGAPPAPVYVSSTPVSINFTLKAPTDDGGAAIIDYTIQRSKVSNFATIDRQWVSGSLSQSDTTGLTPSTTYYYRYLARNATGNSVFSGVMTQATGASSPPGIAVAAAVTGRTATITLAPPAGITPSSYTIERRVFGTTTPVTTLTATASPYTASGLTPGVKYEWRAAANITGYTSPFSGWVAVTQPNPSTTPGDYFDGSTAAKTDTTYSWDGTANSSTSKATAKAVTGWAVSALASGGTAVIMRQSGGRSQAYAGHVIFTADCTAAGFKAGQSVLDPGRSAVAEGGMYWGSIYVQLTGRSQRLAAVIDWRDSAGGVLGETVGEAMLVDPSDTDWTRLTVLGEAPPLAVWGAVRSVDVAGDGWALWHSGDTYSVDDAMIAVGELYDYFDGNTPDTPEFDYAWLGPENASVSTRTTVLQATVDPFADPDCPPTPTPPTPPAIPDDCIEEVGVWRRYWAQVPVDMISRWLAMVPTITINTGTVAARQVRIRVYENPDAIPPSEFNASNWVSEQIVSYMPPEATYVLDGVTDRMRGTVDEGENWTAVDHLLYGTGGMPATWPVLSCGIGYLMSFDVPLDAPEGNLSTTVALTQRM